MMFKTSEERRAYQRAYYRRTIEKQKAYHRARRPIKTAQRRAWNAANRDKQKAANERMHLKRAYGMTLEAYRTLADAQGGRCAACGEVPSGAGHCGRLHVDHDHDTGEIRGLLCVTCNQGLGQFKDSVLRLQQAIMYLRRYAANRHTA